MTEVRYLRLPDVKHITGLGSSMIYRLMKWRKFPDSVQLLPNAVVWRSDEVQDWIKQTSQRARDVGLGISDPSTTGASDDEP